MLKHDYRVATLKTKLVLYNCIILCIYFSCEIQLTSIKIKFDLGKHLFQRTLQTLSKVFIKLASFQ